MFYLLLFLYIVSIGEKLYLPKVLKFFDFFKQPFKTAVKNEI